MVKDTTFGYVVTYGELMQNAKVLIANYHSLVPVYLIVAALYCLVNYGISKASQRLGRYALSTLRRPCSGNAKGRSFERATGSICCRAVQHSESLYR